VHWEDGTKCIDERRFVRSGFNIRWDSEAEAALGTEFFIMFFSFVRAWREAKERQRMMHLQFASIRDDLASQDSYPSET
jgi:hypothetical protein